MTFDADQTRRALIEARFIQRSRWNTVSWVDGRSLVEGAERDRGLHLSLRASDDSSGPRHDHDLLD